MTSPASRDRADRRISLLYLTPCVDGDRDGDTVDWFQSLEAHSRGRALITTEPSRNRRAREVLPHADEFWPLPDLLAGADFPGFILDFIHTRGVQVLHVVSSRLGFDLLPDVASLPEPPAVVVGLPANAPDGQARYVATRYGNLVDSFCAATDELAAEIAGYGVARGRVHVPAPRADAALYGELVDGRRGRAPAPGEPADAGPPPRISLRNRPALGSPLVSVVVPCFDHGRHLPECLASIERQTYPAVEAIVVDDGSSDAETVELLDRLEGNPGLKLLRLGANRGPSVARNAGIGAAAGRYVLPVDADNVLLPDAIERLVSQLQSGGEHVGFIYPNFQFFGNRDDYLQFPEYNLYTLLRSNYCDASSLIDRELFDAGLRYPEDIVLGHEDWDFVLSLAEHGVHGEPARAKTLLYRRQGFSRSDSVEHAVADFRDRLEQRHPRLYAAADAELKPRWSPALSIVALEPAEPGEEPGIQLAERLAGQSCSDVEVLVRSNGEWPADSRPPGLRRLPAALGRADALAAALEAARGRFLAVASGAGAELLADRAFVEKLLRVFEARADLNAIAFADAGADGRYPFRLLRRDEGPAPAPHAVAWTSAADDRLADPVRLVPGEEVDSLARALAAAGVTVQWRHAPAPEPRPRPPAGEDSTVRRRLRPRRESEQRERELRLGAAPALPRLPPGAVARWEGAPGWAPAATLPLCRHRELGGEQRVVTNERVPPPGFEPEFELGSIQRFSPPGTAKLVVGEGPAYRVLRPGEQPDGGELLLGHLELERLPLLEPVTLALHPATGEQVLVAGGADPLADVAEPLAPLGFVEPFPIQPRQAPDERRPYGLVGLVRSLDTRAGRHLYGAGELPAGELVGELGALPALPQAASVPLWITGDGRVLTDGYAPVAARPSLGRTLHWVAAPLAWRGFGRRAARARALLWRLAEPSRRLSRRAIAPPEPGVGPAGYLFSEPAPGRLALYSALHPVIGDQLLTRYPLEAVDMGYGGVTLLGYVVDSPVLTSSLRLERRSVPWASRFGLKARQA